MAISADEVLFFPELESDRSRLPCSTPLGFLSICDATFGDFGNPFPYIQAITSRISKPASSAAHARRC
jgi:hypothetical protein